MNTLAQEQIQETLAVLHKKADEDQQKISRQREEWQKYNKKGPVKRDKSKHLWQTSYFAVDQEEGKLLYLLSSISKAKNIVEFGCSYGISSIYLAAAAKNNKGKLITTDIEPLKVEGARKNITEAGLNDYVVIFQGDAMDTLKDIEGPVDFLFLDGVKELYLPVLKLLYPKLSENAIIFADNADSPKAKEYVEYFSDYKNEFTSISALNKRAFISYRQ